MPYVQKLQKFLLGSTGLCFVRTDIRKKNCGTIDILVELSRAITDIRTPTVYSSLEHVRTDILVEYLLSWISLCISMKNKSRTSMRTCVDNVVFKYRCPNALIGETHVAVPVAVAV